MKKIEYEEIMKEIDETKLAMLAKDSRQDVRAAVAFSSNTPDWILRILAVDKRMIVKKFVWRNPNASETTRKKAETYLTVDISYFKQNEEIWKLGLPTQITNMLTKNGIVSIKELKLMSESDLVYLDGCGASRARAIIEAIKYW